MEKTYEDITITVSQINKMKHAIGIKRDSIKRYKYTAFRNYYYLSEKNEEWENLINRGFAVKHISDTGGNWYYVTKTGLQFLEKLMFIKIEEDKD